MRGFDRRKAVVPPVSRLHENANDYPPLHRIGIFDSLRSTFADSVVYSRSNGMGLKSELSIRGSCYFYLGLGIVECARCSNRSASCGRLGSRDSTCHGRGQKQSILRLMALQNPDAQMMAPIGSNLIFIPRSMLRIRNCSIDNDSGQLHKILLKYFVFRRQPGFTQYSVFA